MLKVSHSLLTFLSGIVWLVVGFFLLQLGLRLLLDSTPEQSQASYPILQTIGPVIGGFYEAAIAIIAIALYVGFLKGKHVLAKAARKGVERIKSFSNPTSLGNIYSPKYYMLLGGMILLGVSIRYFGVPNDLRGGIDVAIGAALIQGAMEYFRLGYALRKGECA